MRILIPVFMLLLAVPSCGPTPTFQRSIDPVGKIDRSALDEGYKARYDTVQIHSELLDLIRQAHAGVDVLVFLGTWCSDSRREVPRFLKVADSTGIPMERVVLYALDRRKTSPDGLEKKYGIDRVPTFVFMKEGVEIGRIVEVPQTSVEADMLTILAAALTR